MLSKLRNTFKGIRQAIREDNIMKYWQAKKHQQMASQLKSYEEYSDFKINDFSLIYFLINEKDSKGIDTLLQKVSYKQELLDDQNNPMVITPLCYAFLQGDQQIVNVLEKHGADIAKSNSSGQNALHLAAIYKRTTAFKEAVIRKLDYNVQDEYGNTPFHYAARAGCPQMTQTMIAARAKKLQNKINQYPIHMAIESGNDQTFDLLKSDVSGIYPKYHPIHSASRSGNPNMVLNILKIKPSCLNMKDLKGLTALHHAVLLEDTLILKTLLTQSGILVNETDEYGNTPLHLSLMNASLGCSQLLLEHGAHLDTLNQDHLSPADYGISSKQKQIHSLLLRWADKSKKVQEWSSPKY